MLRYIGIIVFLALISSCTYLDNNCCQSHYARCQEIKRQILFINATNNSMIAAQKNAQLDNLYRAYRDNGCT